MISTTHTPLRLGLVGMSHWATAVHGAGAVQHPDVDLVAVWGRHPQRTAAAAEGLGCRATATFEELLGLVDGVAFAVPPDVQARLAVTAADAGKHLLLEKPLALDPNAARAIVAAAARRSVATVVFLTRLWIPETASWLDGLRTRGGWGSGRFTFLASLPRDVLGASPWRAQHGALWDVGPHALSVLERVLGPVVAVSGVAGVRDLVHLAFAHAGGATSSAELTLTAPEAVFENSCSFWGQDACSGPMEPVDLRPEHNAAAYAAALNSLVRSARDPSEPTHVDAAYAAHLTDVLTAASAALARGAVVRLCPV